MQHEQRQWARVNVAVMLGVKQRIQKWQVGHPVQAVHRHIHHQQQQRYIQPRTQPAVGAKDNHPAPPQPQPRPSHHAI